MLQPQTKGVECHFAKLCRTRMHTPSHARIDQVQPRKNLPPLVPEFKQLLHQSDSSPLPPHARKLSTPKRGYVAAAPENHITVGVGFSPEVFVQEALRLQHPAEQQSLFPKEVRANVSHLTSGRCRAPVTRTWMLVFLKPF